jgi:hypothetical protein
MFRENSRLGKRIGSGTSRKAGNFPFTPATWNSSFTTRILKTDPRCPV